MNKLHQALEICLYDVEHGVEIENALLRYPELADELRPLLEASLRARALAVPAPTQEVIRRNRAKLLQHAAQMREGKFASTSRRIWSVPLRRSLVALMVVSLLFVSGTSLVRASTNTLPGDNLYSVKRTWENVLLFVTLNVDKRESLELEYEHERLHELRELFAMGRAADVNFTGYVTHQAGDEWRVSGITVFISSQTHLPETSVVIGSAVRVKGQVQNDRGIAARQIELLPPNSKVPGVEDDVLEIGDESGTNSGNETGEVITPKTPTPEFDPEQVSINGIAASITNNFVVVDGIVVDIRFSEIKGAPRVGAAVRVEGYFDANGILIATKIEFKDNSSGSDDNQNNSNNSNSNNSNNNNNDTDDNGNSNDNHNNDNDNDNNSNDNNNNGNSNGGGDD